ncbi:MAG: zinc ribbon domain-containing protein [Candidatus Omnitrophica bacterium]|nr:zinc ribbon domain-containing protein [Candidatus Omnitrophota bacterium]
MPTYEYECSHCAHRFEVFQSISAKPIKSCPKCKKPVKRLIGTGSGIIFKGPGFYATDYRKKTKNDEAPKHRECPKSKEGCNACPQAHP